MYKSIIEFSRDISLEEIAEYTALINKAFDNRCGKVENSSNDPYILIYKGGEDSFNCIQLGQVDILFDYFEITDKMMSWNWKNADDVGDDCDVIKTYKDYRNEYPKA